MKLPWISRDHHSEVIAAKDALILSLETQNAVLAERLCEPISVKVEMPENLALLQPAVFRRKKGENQTGPAASGKQSPEVDWANVDESNNVLMAQLAAEEFGRMATPVELADWRRRVHRQIAEAKSQVNRTPVVPAVGMLETRQPPAHILKAIEEAERV